LICQSWLGAVSKHGRDRIAAARKGGHHHRDRFARGHCRRGDHVEDDYQSNYIDVHIKNIRKKLGMYASVDWLETVRGVGYKVKT
jgi:DNA-binding response OmpR family regulator